MKTRILAAALLLAGLSGCGASERNAEKISGKTFYYENEGFGGSFKIELQEGGSFQYYVGLLSSYMAHGTWSVSGDVLTLEDSDFQIVNHFQIDGDTLRFQEQDSTNFMYVKVTDGERFNAG